MLSLKKLLGHDEKFFDLLEASAIATVVSTKVLTPRQAIAMAAFFNLTGALMVSALISYLLARFWA